MSGNGPPLLPYHLVKRHGVIAPSSQEVLYRPQAPARVMLELRRHLAGPIRYREVNEEEFNEWLRRIYEREMAESLGAVAELEAAPGAEGSTLQSEDLLEQAADAPVIRFINSMLAEAIRTGASDVHIETYEQRIALRFRVDGVLRGIPAPPRALAPRLISRVKVMARLDIAERRVPQDGRLSVTIAGKAVDIRVSTLPTRHGERVVLRLLDQQTHLLHLDGLGFSKAQRATIDALLARPHGIVLVTGPTGSGKTTTLYACLHALNDGKRNILTVEDPVEYDMEGIGQTPINPKAGLTFAKGLRAILRQDPDVVMVGEIRDRETMDIAVQASLTGHLVLSTLHTNSALGAVSRLLDMGVEPFLLASSLSAVIAQRLVRLLCTGCREPYTPDERERNALHAPADAGPWYRATGCMQCHETGYNGRTALYEVVPIDHALRELIHANAGELALQDAVREWLPSLVNDARLKVSAGITSLEEALRVTRSD